jgi:hypothetical protein
VPVWGCLFAIDVVSSTEDADVLTMNVAAADSGDGNSLEIHTSSVGGWVSNASALID